jgi:hypothetical protein
MTPCYTACESSCLLYVPTDLDSECRALALDVEIQCNYEVVPDIPVDWV